MFNWLRKLFRKKEEKIPIIAHVHKDNDYESGGYHLDPKVDEESQKLTIRIEDLKEQVSAMVKPSTDITKRLAELKEHHITKQFLPEPETRRKTITKSCLPPAERHRESISKFMKGKASNRYLKTIKQSPKIKIEED
jgi:hypothetical protein